MRCTIVLWFALLLLFTGGAMGMVNVNSEVEYGEIWSHYHHGTIVWTISGEEEKILKNALEKNYDFNHNDRIEMNEAVSYLHNLTAVLENQTVGTVIIKSRYDVQPLHGWYISGKAVDMDDAQGLIGPINSTSQIIIKLQFYGYPTNNGKINYENLSSAPIVAAENSKIGDYKVPLGDIRWTHTENGYSISSYDNTPNALMLRYVIGSYYHASGNGYSPDEISRNDYAFWNSPLFLFILLLIALEITTKIEKMYFKSTTILKENKYRKRFSKFHTLLKFMMAFLYVFGSLYIVEITGAVYIVMLVGYVGTIAVVSKYFYLLIPKDNEPVVEDVFLLSKSGLMISHETRRLKPDIDEDILSGMLVAIQEFVKDSFKDEGEVNLNMISFGDKNIFIQRGKYLLLAAVLRGNLEQHTRTKLEHVLDKIENKYAAILENWDGDVERFRGVREILREIWT